MTNGTVFKNLKRGESIIVKRRTRGQLASAAQYYKRTLKRSYSVTSAPKGSFRISRTK